MKYIIDDLNNQVGVRLRNLRLGKGLSVPDLVRALEDRKHYVDVRTVRRYEKGDFLPKLETLLHLAELFDTTLDYLIAGTRVSDDYSLTYYDNFKRLNRLIYSFFARLVQDDGSGKIYLELWDDAAKVYWEKLQSLGVTESFLSEKYEKTPSITLEKMDELIADFAEYKEQLLPNKKRLEEFLRSQGIDPPSFYEKMRNR